MIIPRVVIAAPGSDHGKTSVATGLLGALRLAPQGIFLLHEAFYDDDGQALQPAVDVE